MHFYFANVAIPAPGQTLVALFSDDSSFATVDMMIPVVQSGGESFVVYQDYDQSMGYLSLALIDSTYTVFFEENGGTLVADQTGIVYNGTGFDP